MINLCRIPETITEGGWSFCLRRSIEEGKIKRKLACREMKIIYAFFLLSSPPRFDIIERTNRINWKLEMKREVQNKSH